MRLARQMQLFIILFSCLNLSAQSNDLEQKPWNAFWITGPGSTSDRWSTMADETLQQYGVYKFRKVFTLDSVPSKFVVYVSADNRYKLYINGQLISTGPTRGDLYYWNYQVVDLAPYLRTGENLVAALVWNDGKAKPEAQISFMTGFILQGEDTRSAIINTNNSWKASLDSSYSPIIPRVPGYYVAGPGERIDMRKHIKNWERLVFDDKHWQPARQIFNGLTRNAALDSRGWMLVRSPLPAMELSNQRLQKLRYSVGVQAPAGFPSQPAAFTIPANTRAVLLLDQGHLTNAYPTFVFSKGRDAGVRIGYAEALYVGKEEDASRPWIPTLPKGNRNEVAGKIFIGKADSIVSDGSDEQTFTSLWWRTYRYIQVVIQTKDEPLMIKDVYGTFTGFPFVQQAKFVSGDSLHERIFDIGWRTARLCAFETYMDCPYYEQLQYIGDARIQALVSYFNAGDDRLAKYAIELMDRSRLAEGITLSRYPTDLDQQIPTFSLWWIGMIHDYWRYRDDSTFVKEKLPGTRQVLNFFNRYQQKDGRLKDVPYWNFTDWVEGKKGWNYGMAPVGENGESAVLDLQLMWIYQQAAELERAMGLKELAAMYERRAKQMAVSIREHYFDDKRKLFADNEQKNKFSQHANTLAILSGLVKDTEATDIAKRILSDTSLDQASIYFKYYVHRALSKAGLASDYMQWLEIWKQNMNMGLTTWAEISEIDVARSDCHAWGSSPNIEFFRTVLGIDSDGAGFRKIVIEPHPGGLQYVQGEMPHPQGRISVSINPEQLVIEIPPKTTGQLKWKGKIHTLKGGRTIVKNKL